MACTNCRGRREAGCGCAVEAGTNVSISGAGTLSDPWVFDVADGDGVPGPPGTQWFNGSGAPADPYPGANPGDYYLDDATGDVYLLEGA